MALPLINPNRQRDLQSNAPLGAMDAFIAATARQPKFEKLTLAMRNQLDFERYWNRTPRGG
jgi:hypothetical protein